MPVRPVRALGAALVLLAMFLTALLGSTARAGSCQGVGCVTAGPRLAQVDSTQGPLLNALLGGLLGSSLNVSVADWNALNSNSVDLGLFLNALQARTSTGSTTAALNANATLAQFLGAAVDAAQLQGDTAAVNAIGALTGGLNVPALNLTARVGDFLRLSFNQAAFAGTRLNLLNLVTGGVQLFNSANTLTTASNPISLGSLSVNLSSLGIAGLSATTPTVTLYAQVTEPPIMICGPSGTQFYTASIRVKLNVDLSGLDNLGVTGVAGATLSLTNVRLYLDVARAQGTLGTVSAVSRALSLQATPGLVNLYLGDIPDSTFFNRTHVLTGADLGYARIGTASASVSVLGVGSQVVNMDVNARASGNGSYPLGTLSFGGPYPQSAKVGSSTAAVPVLVDDLLQTLDVKLTVTSSVLLGLEGAVNTLVSTLTAPVRTLSGTVLRPILVAVLQATVDRLLALLGIGIGQAEVTVLGVNNACTVTGNVYRDTEPDGTRSGTESWGGPAVWVTQTVSGAARQSSAVGASDGAFSFTLGEGTSVLLVSPSAGAITPARPAGYVFVNPVGGSVTRVVDASSTSVPDVSFGLFAGDRVTGTVFRDDGRGGGTPNNARQDGTEPILTAETLTLTGSGGIRTASTDTQGRYTLYVPGGWTANRVSTGSSPVTGVYDGSAVTLAGSVGGTGVRPYPLPDPSGTDRQADFGVVRSLTLSAAAAQSSEAPVTLRYLHTLKPGTLGTLSVSAISAYPARVSLDSNCDGTVDASERATTVTTVTVDAAWPRDPSGDLKGCAAELALDVPAGTPDGSSDNALLNVTLAWSGNAGVTDAAGTADRSTVVPGTVLSKKVSNLTRAPATEADTVDAYPGDTLRYCLTATNTGPFTASAVVVQDTLKPSVTYAPGTLTLDGTTLTDAADTDAGELVARQVTVRVPTLAAGAQTRICFQVLVP
ncbi:DUF11 domain-containing protein [Deinococcus aquiradiocola]|uniref:DUF11 domain-containing protein n=1 Tax=Deinococcus aquiradiocola TaxID=393059 RepID=UPI0016668764|nr:DUF11 domain-containing protein [Deinococcus aquiradiocola]